MPRSLSACRSGLAVTAVAVLLSGCGGSGDGQAAAATSSQGGPGFCTEAASIQERIGSTVNDPSERANLPGVLLETAKEVRAIHAPSTIAADWNALAEGAEQLSVVIGSVDPDRPGDFAGIEQQLNDITARFTGASTNVSTYLRDECGIHAAPTTRPASPTG
jgi:hypothetical protein